MNFAKPERSQTHEEWVAQESERMKWRREKFAQQRKASQDGFYDEETVIPARPTVCISEGCDRAVKARGLCERDYKRKRRAVGKPN